VRAIFCIDKLVYGFKYFIATASWNCNTVLLKEDLKENGSLEIVFMGA